MHDVFPGLRVCLVLEACDPCAAQGSEGSGENPGESFWVVSRRRAQPSGTHRKAAAVAYEDRESLCLENGRGPSTRRRWKENERLDRR